MIKKKLVISYDNLPSGVLEEIHKQYPEGWAHHVIKVPLQKDSFFYAILVETAEVTYLVKVKVKKDRKGIDEDDLIPDFEDIEGADTNFNGQDNQDSTANEE